MERSSLSSLISSRARRKRIGWSLLIALAIAVVLTAARDTKHSSAVLRGDFPAFYSLGAIAASDSPQRLYDLEEQTRIQNETWPDMKGSVLPGAYPPYVAYLAQPLVTLGPVGGKATLTVVSLALFFIAVFLLSRAVPTLRGAAVELSVALLLFSPVLMGVIGGQLLSMSMLLYVLMMMLDRVRDSKSEYLLGVVIGAWLFKPQYALLALLLRVVQGRLRVVIGFVVPALFFYVLGVQVLGFDWLAKWAAFTREFSDMNYASNAAQMSNIVGGTLALLKLSQVDDTTIHVGRSIALAVCVLVVGWLVITAWRDRRWMSDPHSELPSRAMLLLGPTLACANPQANFYDLGLAVVPFVILVRPTVRDWVLQFGTVVALGLLAMSVKGTDVPLFAIVSLAIFVTIVCRIRVCYRGT